MRYYNMILNEEWVRFHWSHKRNDGPVVVSIFSEEFPFTLRIDEECAHLSRNHEYDLCTQLVHNWVNKQIKHSGIRVIF